MTKPGAPATGPLRRPAWGRAAGTAASRPPAPPPVPKVQVPVQAYASREQLSHLLPSAWADSHTIEAQDGGLCIRGPQAQAIAAQLCHAVDLLSLLGMRDSLATDVLMDQPGGVALWQALSIRESPDWGRIQGEVPACLALLEQLRARRLLLACHLFVRLTPALQLGVLQAVPAFERRFGQALAQELASTLQSLQSSPPTALWCQLELQRLDCLGLQEAMDGSFRDLAQRAVAEGDAAALALLLRACPSGTLPALLRTLRSWQALSANCAAEPDLAAALEEAQARVAATAPPPVPTA